MNKKFVIYNSQGVILRTGDCPEEVFSLQVSEGEFIVEAQACCRNDSVNLETGEIVHGGGLPEVPVETPIQNASMSTAEQLDLLWQAMDAGTYPKAEPFYSAIKAQKEAASLT